jgi:hypothetical protein
MNHERLNETIERVARDMTMVTTTFSLDRREAQQGSGRAAWSFLVVTAAAASVAVAAVLSTWQVRHSGDVVESVQTLASRTLAPLSAWSVASREPIVVAPALNRSPVSLAIAPLSVEPLLFGDMTVVEPLTVKDIAIAEIPGGDKEYR